MSTTKALVTGLFVCIAGAALADEPRNPSTTSKPEDKAGRVPAGSLGEEKDRTLAAGAPVRGPSGHEKVIASWPDRPREVAELMVAEYGDPDEVSESRLTWRSNGIWKETIVHRHEVIHDFPKPHSDVLEQVIDYQVPTDMVDELLEFDGSLTVRRTAGTLSAHCDDEALNILALNLAHEIIAGDKKVSEARKAFAQGLVDLLKKKSPTATEKLLFDVSSIATADPDKPYKLRMTK